MEANKELTQITKDDFIGDNYDKFKMLSLYSKQKDIVNLKNNIMSNRNSMYNSPEGFKYIDDSIKDYTEDDIKKMSAEKINEIFGTEDDNPIINTERLSDGTNIDTEFKRDFLIFQKQAQDAMNTIEEEEKKLQESIAEEMKMFDDTVNTYGDIQTLVKSTILEKIANADNDHDRQLYQAIMVEYDNGFTLNNLINYCQSYKAKNIYSEFRLDNDKTDYIYRRYLKECKSLGIEEDEITRFTKLESRFLPEKYHNYDNLFMFAVIHFIASWHGKNTNSSRGLFITEFMINIKNLYYNKFDNEEDKESFCNNIIKVLDLILA